MVFYAGHGNLTYGTQHVSLHDNDSYELEIKIRNFKNDFVKNAYVWGVFDTCRSVQAPINQKVRAGGQ
jgi:hypothetical protein